MTQSHEAVVGARRAVGCSRRLWQGVVVPSLWVLCLLLALPVGTASAAPGFRFSTNPPEKQHDFFAQDAASRQRLQVVEQHHWPQSLKAMSREDWRTAHQELDFILRWIPNHPYALDQYSRFAVRTDRLGLAKQYFDYALQFSPDNPSTYLVYGMHLHRVANYSEALEKLKQALRLAPDSADVHYNLGLTYFRLERLAEARKHAQRAYALGSRLPGLREMLRTAGAWRESPG